jgi:hypothetical protein
MSRGRWLYLSSVRTHRSLIWHLEAGLAISVLCGRLLYHACRDDSSVISAMAFRGTGHGCKVLGRSVTFTPDPQTPGMPEAGSAAQNGPQPRGESETGARGGDLSRVGENDHGSGLRCRGD